MKMKMLSSLAVATTLGILMPAQANAFGLGVLQLDSALNQPFKAAIPLTAVQPDEIGNIQVRLSSNEEYEKAGLERNYLLSSLSFEVAYDNDKPRIEIRSAQPIREPFLDFLITASAGEGKLIREYTVLLDPPKQVFNEPAAAPQPQTTAAPVTEQAAVSSESAAPVTPTYPTSNTATEYGPVKRTDTLWEIALDTRPNRAVTVHQMMHGLLEKNPAAFQSHNINGLKAGYVLQIPSLSEINQLSAEQARQASQAQNQQWKNRNALPKDTADAADAPAESSLSSALDTTTPVSLPEHQSPTAEAPATAVTSDSKLELVAPSEQEPANDQATSVQGDEKLTKLTEQLTLAQETIEAQQQENIDFKQRMEAMEEQLTTLRRLISLKDEDLARLQHILQQDPNAAQGIETEQTAELADTEQQEMQTLFSKIKQFAQTYQLELALGALFILLLMWTITRRRTEKLDLDDTEEAPLAEPVVTEPARQQPEVHETSVSASSAKPMAPRREKTVAELIEQADMFLGYADYMQARSALEQASIKEPYNTTVAQKLLFVLFKQQQKDAFVDLALSADIDRDSDDWQEIAAWGRELAPNNALFAAKAEPVPAEPEITEALPENDIIETEQDDVDEEITLSTVTDDLAGEAVDSESAEQAAVHFDDSPLEFNLSDYEADDVVTESAEADSEDKQDKQVHSTVSADSTHDLLSDELLAFVSSPRKTSLSPDPEVIDLDEAALDELLKPASAAYSKPLDVEPLDLDSDEADITEVPSAASVDDELDAFAPHPLSNDVDSSDEDDAPAEVSLPNKSVYDFGSVSGSDEIDFDLGDIDEIDEAETKLDLASAYIDMGDPEGAQVILQEVLQEGNVDQQGRAQAMLKEISE